MLAMADLRVASLATSFAVTQDGRLIRFQDFFFGVDSTLLKGASYAGLSGPKFTLRYSIKASRSFASTAAPHLVILSTSFTHAALLSRCCTIIRASWQVRHAAAAFAFAGP